MSESTAEREIKPYLIKFKNNQGQGVVFTDEDAVSLLRSCINDDRTCLTLFCGDQLAFTAPTGEILSVSEMKDQKLHDIKMNEKFSEWTLKSNEILQELQERYDLKQGSKKKLELVK